MDTLCITREDHKMEFSVVNNGGSTYICSQCGDVEQVLEDCQM